MNCFILILSICISIAFGELAVRALDGNWRWGNHVVDAMDIIKANSAVMEHDTMIGWRLKPNYRSDGFNTNTLGLRGVPPVQLGSILAVGDSFTAGSGVRDEEAWPAVLERLINVPVANGSAGAYAVDQIVLRAEQLSPVVMPRRFIYGVLSQDILRNAYGIFGGGAKPWFAPGGRLQGAPVPEAASAPFQLRWWHAAGYSYAAHSALKAMWPQRWLDNNTRYRRVMSNEAAAMRACDLTERMLPRSLLVVMYGATELTQDDRPWFVVPMLKCAEATGLVVVDTWDAFRAHKPFDELWLDEGGQRGHPTAKGHALIARLVAGVL